MDFMQDQENDPIRSYQSRMDRSKDNAESLRPVLKAVQDAMTRAGVEVSIVVGTRNPLDPKIEIMKVIDKMDEILPLFRELAKEGIHTDKEKGPSDNNAYGVVGVRTYEFNSRVLLIAVIPNVSDDPTPGKCRLVQTGVKEVPVYDVQCDED